MSINWKLISRIEELSERADFAEEWIEHVNQILEDHNKLFHEYQQFMNKMINEITYLNHKKDAI